MSRQFTKKKSALFFFPYFFADKSGFLSLEIVIGLAILLFSFSAVTAAYNSFTAAAIRNINELKAVYLAEEGLEVIRAMRDAGWSINIETFVTGVPRYLVNSGGEYSFYSTPTFTDGHFERAVVLDRVFRDSEQDIAESGIEDADMKKVSVSVSWRDGSATTTREFATYIANLFNN